MALKILIVDDETAIRLALERVLRADGHDVGFSSTGEGALDLLEQEVAFGAPFDLVLLDVNLEGALDGLDVSQRMRAHPSEVVRSTAVFLVTGLPPDAVVKRRNSKVSATLESLEAVRIIVQKPIDYNAVLGPAIRVLEASKKG